jgi:hypothetical protein
MNREDYVDNNDKEKPCGQGSDEELSDESYHIENHKPFEEALVNKQHGGLITEVQEHHFKR